MVYISVLDTSIPYVGGNDASCRRIDFKDSPIRHDVVAV